MSLYQLTIEDGTAFGARHARGLLPGLPTDDIAADMFDLTQGMMRDAEMPAYEVSNHAKTGQKIRFGKRFRGKPTYPIVPGGAGH